MLILNPFVQDLYITRWERPDPVPALIEVKGFAPEKAFDDSQPAG
jgi:hypothetical protein